MINCSTISSELPDAEIFWVFFHGFLSHDWHVKTFFQQRSPDNNPISLSAHGARHSPSRQNNPVQHPPVRLPYWPLHVKSSRATSKFTFAPQCAAPASYCRSAGVACHPPNSPNPSKFAAPCSTHHNCQPSAAIPFQSPVNAVQLLLFVLTPRNFFWSRSAFFASWSAATFCDTASNQQLSLLSVDTSNRALRWLGADFGVVPVKNFVRFRSPGAAPKFFQRMSCTQVLRLLSTEKQFCAEIRTSHSRHYVSTYKSNYDMHFMVV